MSTIEAIYQGGVFKPLSDVALRENQRVRLDVRPLDADAVQTWLHGVQQLQQRLVAEKGFFPDSTPDIAADRRRDE